MAPAIMALSGVVPCRFYEDGDDGGSHDDPAGDLWDLPDGGDDKPGTLAYYIKRRNELVCIGSKLTVTEMSFAMFHNKVRTFCNCKQSDTLFLYVLPASCADPGAGLCL